MPAGGQAQVLNPEGGFGVIVSHIVLASDIHVRVPLSDGESLAYLILLREHMLGLCSRNFGQQGVTDAWVLLEAEKE